jgi:hypothetical protein
MEVVLSIMVPIAVLTRSSSGVGELSLEVSEALGVSLSKVHNLYSGGSDEVKNDRIMAEERDCIREHQQYEEGRREMDKGECQAELQSYYEDTTF